MQYAVYTPLTLALHRVTPGANTWHLPLMGPYFPKKKHTSQDAHMFHGFTINLIRFSLNFFSLILTPSISFDLSLIFNYFLFHQKFLVLNKYCI